MARQGQKTKAKSVLKVIHDLFLRVNLTPFVGYYLLFPQKLHVTWPR